MANSARFASPTKIKEKKEEKEKGCYRKFRL